MRSAGLFSACVALACARALGAANIDSGFAQDGVTTYCQGVRGATANPVEFLELEAHIAGRCPIDVKLDIKATTVGVQAPMDVQWAASVRQGDVPGNIFPRAVDPATKKPQNVIASILRACKAGTNCAPESIVIPQVVGPAEAETGAFNDQGQKPLRAFRFLFNDPGHYVVVGIVVLPGDAMLNVSASEFITFQRVTVVEGVGPATVAPPSQVSEPEVGAEGKTDNIDFTTNLVKSTAAVPITPVAPANAAAGTAGEAAPAGTRNPSGVDASFSGNNKSGDDAKPDTGSNLNMMLVLGAVAVILIAVLLYFVIVKRKSRSVKNPGGKKPLDPHGEAGIFRLTISGNEMTSSLSIASLPKHQINGGSSSVYSGGSSQMSLAPPRFTTSSQGSTDSGPFSRATRPGSNQFPSYENAALAASGKEFQPTTRQQPPLPANARQPSLASMASSSFSDFDDDDAGTFGNLHDSAEQLPVVGKHARSSVASSTSSYGEYDQRASSRLYSEGSVKMPRDMSEFSSAYSDRDSEFNGSTRSTELGALSERGTRLGEYEV